MPAENFERKIKVPEKKFQNSESSSEGRREIGFLNESGLSEQEKIVAEKIRQELKMMETDEKLSEDARAKASKIEFLGEKDKIDHLLKIAKEKGVIFAIKTAKETNDPYLLDLFHDILAKEGYYQKFIK
jgi:hypothetical protein